MHQCFNRMLVLEAMKFFGFDIRAAIEEAASLTLNPLRIHLWRNYRLS